MHELSPEVLPTLNPEQLKAREGMESNPANYSIECHPKNLGVEGRTNSIDTLKSIVSGFIDFRNTAENSSDKNTIWLGRDHYEIAFDGAKFHEGLNTKDYIIGIKTKYDQTRRQLRIVDDLIGQSCNREPGHIEKIIKAANIAITRDLVEEDPNLQKQFFLEDYGFGKSADISDRQIYTEGIAPNIDKEESTDTDTTYDLMLLSAVDGHNIIDSASKIELGRKIDDLLPKLSKDSKASIRVPFTMIAKTDDPDELYKASDQIRAFTREFEATHQGKYCEVNITRRARKTNTLPEQTWGVIIIGNDY